ncbi:PAS domain S-box protein [Rubripirellula lacrimiformis]|uniref:PAS domain S-box protein n=1 Tax=Rubripirellula lacrimiformis TaxID=1930273 RepID=UPI001C54F976|nr:PAS domain S-box protein [Rubripirellula lacrimiformis]
MPASSCSDDLRQFADSLPLMVWGRRPDGFADFFNQQWCNQTGQTHQQAQGDGWMDVIHCDDRGRAVAAWQDAGQSLTKYEIDLRYRMADGNYRWHQLQSTPTMDIDGGIKSWFGISTDIDQRHVDDVITRAIVESAVDAIVTIDDRGIVQSCNPATEQLFDYQTSEIVGQNVAMLMPESYASNHDGYIANYLRTGEKKIIGLGRDVEGRRKDGTTFPMTLAVSEVRVDGHSLFAGVVRDISKRKGIENDLRGQTRVLESLAQGNPLGTVLHTLIEVAEQSRPEMIGSILLVDEKSECLRHAASRRLPDFFRDACDGMEMGPEAGSCGTAAFTGKRVIVDDIDVHRFWVNDRDIARQAGLRSCWSEPIVHSDGRILGTFAMYYREPRSPSESDLEFVSNAAKLAALAIERAAADRSLRDAAAIVESTNDAIILKNLDGIIEKWNQGAEQVYGYTAAQAIGKPIQMLVPEDRLYELSANTEKIQRGERIDHFETIRLAKDGRRIHVSSTISPVRDVDGNLRHFVDVQNDITRRVQAQSEISRERAFLDTIVNGVPDALGFSDLDRKFTHCNQKMQQVFGYESEELIGQSAAVLYADPADYEHQGAQRFNPTAKENVEVVEVDWRRKNGDVFTGELVGTIIRDDSGKPLGYLSLVRDITDRKHAEAAIRESQRKLSTLMSNLPGAAFRCSVDDNFTFEFLSDGCSEVFGYSASELTSARMLIPPDEFERVSATVTQSLAERQSFDFVHRIRHRLGDLRWVSAKGQAIFSQQGDWVAIEGFVSDITDLHDAREKLVQSERLAAVGQMLSAIAHESRNALQRIQVGVDMLGFTMDEDDDAHKDLSRITKAKSDLQRLLEELHGYASPLRLDCSICSLASIWQQAWNQIDDVHRDRDAELVEKTGDVSSMGQFDAFRLAQVFRNLFENSLAACREPVRITVHCRETVLDQNDQTRVPALRVTVRDNGPGLNEEQKQKVFEAFYSTKPKGSGLGMAIALRIVQAHRGTISAGSGVGGGAEFVLVLPRKLP